MANNQSEAVRVVLANLNGFCTDVHGAVQSHECSVDVAVNYSDFKLGAEHVFDEVVCFRAFDEHVENVVACEHFFCVVAV